MQAISCNVSISTRIIELQGTCLVTVVNKKLAGKNYLNKKNLVFLLEEQQTLGGLQDMRY